MYFSIGVFELVLTILLGVTALTLHLRRDRNYHWAVVAFLSALVAAVVTPSDIISMLVLFLAFLGFFAFGTRFRDQVVDVRRSPES